MPHFTLRLDAAGPVINAVISVSQGRRAALEAAKLPIPPPRSIRVLVDTGASFSSIEPTILQALELTPTGTVDIVTPSTGSDVHTTDTYDVDLAIYRTPSEPPLLMPNLRIAASHLFLKQGIHGLLGREVLSRCLFVYNGEQNLFSLAF